MQKGIWWSNCLYTLINLSHFWNTGPSYISQVCSIYYYFVWSYMCETLCLVMCDVCAAVFGDTGMKQFAARCDSETDFRPLYSNISHISYFFGWPIKTSQMILLGGAFIFPLNLLLWEYIEDLEANSKAPKGSRSTDGRNLGPWITEPNRFIPCPLLTLTWLCCQ